MRIIDVSCLLPVDYPTVSEIRQVNFPGSLWPQRRQNSFVFVFARNVVYVCERGARMTAC